MEIAFAGPHRKTIKKKKKNWGAGEIGEVRVGGGILFHDCGHSLPYPRSDRGTTPEEDPEITG